MRGSFARFICSLAVVVCASVPMMAAQLIVNGSFEEPPHEGPYQYVPGGSTAISAWTTVHTGVERFSPSRLFMGSMAEDGDFVLDLNTDVGIGGGIQQTIATNVGGTYILTFHLGTFADRGRTGTGTFEVVIGDTVYPHTVTNFSQTIEWTEFTITFVATSTSTTITFQSFDLPNMTFSLLDNVSLSGMPFIADGDNDGILDDDDECPSSDLSTNVVIDGCDTGVSNSISAGGCSISDQIGVCGANARNHGQYVSCVAYVTNQLKKAGVISGQEKGAIQSCAARSNIGK